jgi:2-polyprenyl-3-methyl-5-hydroxy-6-metoxy-1,4-benzoquinol methylase
VPVREHKPGVTPLSQRAQYAKGGIGKAYWDYRDKVALSLLDERDLCIVDLGCGEGITLERLTNMIPSRDIVGIDYLQDNVDICIKHSLPARQGNIYDLDMDARSVDAVILMEVIEHLEDPKKAIRELQRILKPEGKLIVVFPNDLIFKIARILTLKFQEAAYDPGHVKQWRHHELIKVLNHNGFSVQTNKSIPFYFWPISLHGIVSARKKL